MNYCKIDKALHRFRVVNRIVTFETNDVLTYAEPKNISSTTTSKVKCTALQSSNFSFGSECQELCNGEIVFCCCDKSCVHPETTEIYTLSYGSEPRLCAISDFLTYYFYSEIGLHYCGRSLDKNDYCFSVYDSSGQFLWGYIFKGISLSQFEIYTDFTGSTIFLLKQFGIVLIDKQGEVVFYDETMAYTSILNILKLDRNMAIADLLLFRDHCFYKINSTSGDIDTWFAVNDEYPYINPPFQDGKQTVVQAARSLEQIEAEMGKSPQIYKNYCRTAICVFNDGKLDMEKKVLAGWCLVGFADNQIYIYDDYDSGRRTDSAKHNRLLCLNLNFEIVWVLELSGTLSRFEFCIKMNSFFLVELLPEKDHGPILLRRINSKGEILFRQEISVDPAALERTVVLSDESVVFFEEPMQMNKSNVCIDVKSVVWWVKS